MFISACSARATSMSVDRRQVQDARHNEVNKEKQVSSGDRDVSCPRRDTAHAGRRPTRRLGGKPACSGVRVGTFLFTFSLCLISTLM